MVITLVHVQTKVLRGAIEGRRCRSERQRQTDHEESYSTKIFATYVYRGLKSKQNVQEKETRQRMAYTTSALIVCVAILVLKPKVS